MSSTASTSTQVVNSEGMPSGCRNVPVITDPFPVKQCVHHEVACRCGRPQEGVSCVDP